MRSKRKEQLDEKLPDYPFHVLRHLPRQRGPISTGQIPLIR
jgi:hypothetical protein